MQKLDLGYKPMRGQVEILKSKRLMDETAVVVGGESMQISTSLARFANISDSDFARTRLGSRNSVFEFLKKQHPGFSENEFVVLVEFL